MRTFKCRTANIASGDQKLIVPQKHESGSGPLTSRTTDDDMNGVNKAETNRKGFTTNTTTTTTQYRQANFTKNSASLLVQQQQSSPREQQSATPLAMSSPLSSSLLAPEQQQQQQHMSKASENPALTRSCDGDGGGISDAVPPLISSHLPCSERLHRNSLGQGSPLLVKAVHQLNNTSEPSSLVEKSPHHDTVLLATSNSTVNDLHSSTNGSSPGRHVEVTPRQLHCVTNEKINMGVSSVTRPIDHRRPQKVLMPSLQIFPSGSEGNAQENLENTTTVQLLNQKSVHDKTPGKGQGSSNVCGSAGSVSLSRAALATTTILGSSPSTANACQKLMCFHPASQQPQQPQPQLRHSPSPPDSVAKCELERGLPPLVKSGGTTTTAKVDTAGRHQLSMTRVSGHGSSSSTSGGSTGCVPHANSGSNPVVHVGVVPSAHAPRQRHDATAPGGGSAGGMEDLHHHQQQHPFVSFVLTPVSTSAPLVPMNESSPGGTTSGGGNGKNKKMKRRGKTLDGASSHSGKGHCSPGSSVVSFAVSKSSARDASISRHSGEDTARSKEEKQKQQQPLNSPAGPTVVQSPKDVSSPRARKSKEEKQKGQITTESPVVSTTPAPSPREERKSHTFAAGKYSLTRKDDSGGGSHHEGKNSGACATRNTNTLVLVAASPPQLPAAATPKVKETAKEEKVTDNNDLMLLSSPGTPKPMAPPADQVKPPYRRRRKNPTNLDSAVNLALQLSTSAPTNTLETTVSGAFATSVLATSESVPSLHTESSPAVSGSLKTTVRSPGIQAPSAAGLVLSACSPPSREAQMQTPHAAPVTAIVPKSEGRGHPHFSNSPSVIPNTVSEAIATASASPLTLPVVLNGSAGVAAAAAAAALAGGRRGVAREGVMLSQGHPRSTSINPSETTIITTTAPTTTESALATVAAILVADDDEEEEEEEVQLPSFLSTTDRVEDFLFAVRESSSSTISRHHHKQQTKQQQQQQVLPHGTTGINFGNGSMHSLRCDDANWMGSSLTIEPGIDAPLDMGINSGTRTSAGSPAGSHDIVHLTANHSSHGPKLPASLRSDLSWSQRTPHDVTHDGDTTSVMQATAVPNGDPHNVLGDKMAAIRMGKVCATGSSLKSIEAPTPTTPISDRTTHSATLAPVSGLAATASMDQKRRQEMLDLFLMDPDAPRRETVTTTASTAATAAMKTPGRDNFEGVVLSGGPMIETPLLCSPTNRKHSVARTVTMVTTTTTQTTTRTAKVATIAVSGSTPASAFQQQHPILLSSLPEQKEGIMKHCDSKGKPVYDEKDGGPLRLEEVRALTPQSEQRVGVGGVLWAVEGVEVGEGSPCVLTSEEIRLPSVGKAGKGAGKKKKKKATISGKT